MEKYNRYMDKITLIKIIIILKIIQELSLCQEKIGHINSKHKQQINKNNKREKTREVHIKEEKGKKDSSKLIASNKEKEHNEITDEVSKNINNQVNKEDNKEIKKKVYKNKEHNLVAHMPVIIAEKQVSIPIEKIIDFKEIVTDIRRVKSDVYLTRKTFIGLDSKEDNSNGRKGELFLRGVVKNTIEYSALEEVNKDSYIGYIKSMNTFFPFKFNTTIECAELHDCSKNDFNSKKIECFVKEAQIAGSDKILEPNFLDKGFKYGRGFKRIKRNVVVNLVLSIIQVQPVSLKEEDIILKPSTE